MLFLCSWEINVCIASDYLRSHEGILLLSLQLAPALAWSSRCLRQKGYVRECKRCFGLVLNIWNASEAWHSMKNGHASNSKLCCTLPLTDGSSRLCCMSLCQKALTERVLRKGVSKQTWDFSPMCWIFSHVLNQWVISTWRQDTLQNHTSGAGSRLLPLVKKPLQIQPNSAVSAGTPQLQAAHSYKPFSPGSGEELRLHSLWMGSDKAAAQYQWWWKETILSVVSGLDAVGAKLQEPGKPQPPALPDPGWIGLWVTYSLKNSDKKKQTHIIFNQKVALFPVTFADLPNH